MEGISKNIKQTLESVKFTSEVKERQNRTNTLKFVNKTPIGLPLSPKQFKEFDGLFLHQPNNRVSTGELVERKLHQAQ